MPAIPTAILTKLYVKGSMRVTGRGLALDLTNPIAPGTILAVERIELDGAPIPLERVVVTSEGQHARPAAAISRAAPLPFPLRATLTLHVSGVSLAPGRHALTVRVAVQDVGTLEIPITDEVD